MAIVTSQLRKDSHESLSLRLSERICARCGRAADSLWGKQEPNPHQKGTIPVRTHHRAFGVALALLAGADLALGQETLFSYQGQLKDGGTPADGIYDFQFTLRDAATLGNTIGSPVITDDVLVANGVFTVTLDFGAEGFPGADRWLEIAVRPGASSEAFTVLSPSQPVTATPYAIRAAHAIAADSAATAATAASVTGPVAASQITGTFTAASLAPGAAVGNLAASGQAGVASGGFVLATEESAALVNAGYVRIGTTVLSDGWQPRVNGTTPDARYQHTAVWTGSEMILWGGCDAVSLNSGGRYDPASDRWTATTTAGAPAARRAHTAVWTGRELIVWGGEGTAKYNDTWSYTPGEVMFLYRKQ